jgi:hypothetical protein
MTSLETCIREAVEKGGYKGAKSVKFPPLEYSSITIELKTGGLLHYFFSEILLDPLFWQALGRARGKEGVWQMYENGAWQISDESAEIQSRTPFAYPWWHYQWIRLIDHLAERKDAKSFFAAL